MEKVCLLLPEMGVIWFSLESNVMAHSLTLIATFCFKKCLRKIAPWLGSWKTPMFSLFSKEFYSLPSLVGKCHEWYLGIVFYLS